MNYGEALTEIESALGDKAGPIVEAIKGRVESTLEEKRNAVAKSEAAVKKAEARIDEVTQQLTASQGEVGELKKEGGLRDFAQKSGVSLTVLKRLATDEEFSIVAGQDGEIPTVTKGDKAFSLADYAKKNWGDFVPALFPAAEGDSGGSRTQQKRIPGQPGKGSTKTDNPVKSFVKRYSPTSS